MHRKIGIVVIFMALRLVLVALSASASEAAAHSPSPRQSDRAIAFGLLLDNPRPQEVIDEGLIVAEQLIRIYGIDTGNRFADYREAAERARDEILEPLDPSAQELAGVAESLGYSLLPERCKNYCDNVERLARAELARRILKNFIAAGSKKVRP